MEAETIDIPSATLAQLKSVNCEREEKNYDDAKHRITMPPTSQTEPMKTQTPNPQTITSQTANHLTVEGKMKAPIGTPAPLLQDVFPESASTTDSTQKTLAPSDTGQGKRAQLENEKGQKRQKSRPGGRRKLNASERREIKLQLHVTKDEYDLLKTLWQASGQRFISDYLRSMVLEPGKAKNLVNNSALIRQLDKTGTTLSKIGSNINQLARYANIQMKTGKIDQRTMVQFNLRMDQYLREQKELSKAYRALVRSED